MCTHKDQLTGNPIFQGFTDAQIERVAALFTPVRFAAGDQVFGQGDLASQIYLLETGEVALRHYAEDGGCLTIALIEKDGVFGWSAALGRTRYTSFAVCTRDARALVARGGDLRSLVQDDPVLGRKILGRIALAVAGRSEEAHAQFARLIQDEMSHAPLDRSGG